MKTKLFTYYSAVSIFLLSLFLILGSFLVVNFVSAATIKFETPIAVKWSSANVDPSTCTRTLGYTSWPSGSSAVSGRVPYGSGTITPNTYTFRFSCVGAAGSNQAGNTIIANASLTVKTPNISLSFNPIPPPVIVPSTLSFNTNRSMIFWGQSYTLTWNFTGTEADENGACTASGNWSGPRNRSGSQTFYTKSGSAFDGSVSYTLTCTADNGSIIRTQTVDVDMMCDSRNTVCA